MNYKMRDIAEIRLGVALRSKVEHDPAGRYQVVQAKDIVDDCRLNLGGIFRVSMLRFKPAQRLRTGDVLLQTRGVRYPVALVNGDLEEAVAAAPLYVIRPKPNAIDPGYLVGFLSNPLTQHRMRQRATGTYVPQIARAELENFEIPVPPLGEQRRLADLARLIHREQKLAMSLADRRSELLWTVMKEAAKEKTQGRANAPGP